MNALHNGPHTLKVYLEGVVSDGYGGSGTVRAPSDTPTLVRGWLQPLSAAQAALSGTQVTATDRFIAPSMPGGGWARVTCGDREFTVIGEPERHDYGSPAGQHAEVLLRARAPEAMP